jgi:hypothetical protein
MTEAELVEAITSYFDIAVATLTLYMTVCSGYLIVAYMVGGNLTTSQAFIVSTLYCFIAAVTTYAFYAWAQRALDYLVIQESSGISSIDTAATPIMASVLTAIMSAGVLACLKFMWDVRHPKDE